MCFIATSSDRRFAPGEEFEDDPMMIEFATLERQRQNPPEELQSNWKSSLSLNIVLDTTCVSACVPRCPHLTTMNSYLL